MKIHWKKVTWYSKTLALILFVVLPFFGFYLGVVFTKETLAIPTCISSIISGN